MANGKKTDQAHIEIAERRVKVLELRKAGASFRAIGRELGISEAQAHRDYKAAMAGLIALGEETAAEYRTMELLRLDGLMLDTYRILRADHPVISGGKVLSGFTESGKVIGLTDDKPKLEAIAELRRISESRRKLLGLDAPAKVAPVNPDGTAYEGQSTMIAIVMGLLAPYPDLRLALAAQLTEEADADVQE